MREGIDPAFLKPGTPARVRPFPRGENSRRRFPEVKLAHTSEAARRAPPVAMARIPADGRLALTKEETDLHTARGLRMVLEVQALERVAAGGTARLLLPLPDGSSTEARIDRVRNRGGMTFTLEGELVSEPRSSVVQLVLHDGIVHGSLARYDVGQHVEYTVLSSGHMAVRELDTSTMVAGCGNPDLQPLLEGPAHGEELAEEPSATEPAAEASGGPAAETPGYVTIDVVVGYGREARIADGGVSQIEARIIASVDRMNAAFGNSLVANTELMLLGTIEDPDYVYPGAVSGSMSTDDELGDLNSLTDGQLDTVTDYATALGADLRSFVIKQADGSAGIAFRPGRSSIVARDYMSTTRITFVHELGHNIGARHSWGDSSGDLTTTVYSYGWRLDPPSANRVRTIMAYDWGWDRIPYFANPLVEYLGARTGQVDGYDATGDTESDPRYVSGGYIGTAGAGFDGTKPLLGARNADYLEQQAPFKEDDAARTALNVLEPGTGASWEPGTTGTITWAGGDYTDLATIELFKGGVLNTPIASGVRGDDRKQSWAIPAGQAPGDDYMIRVTLNGTEVADSGLFSISFSSPRVIAQTPEPSVGQVAGQTQVSVTFSEVVDPATFSTVDDIVSFTGPGGADLLGSIAGSSWSVGDTVLTVTFAAQNVDGVYRLVLGPDIRDPEGNPMDQDNDGRPGETVEDRYAAILWISSGGEAGTIWSDLVGTDTLDAGWTLSGGSWAEGTPSETPPTGPGAGADGNPILAQNLSGDYIAGENSQAETPVIDCSAWSNVTLAFQAWKGAGKNDVLYVEVFDGAAWRQVFSYTGPNGGAHDTAWTSYAPSLGAYADGNPDFRIRWRLADITVGNSGTETGWQLDAITLSGEASAAPPPPPVVVDHSPSGSTEDSPASWYLAFSQPMDTASFSPADIVDFTGPSGALAADGFLWISDTLLRIDFPEQSAFGTYTLVLAPSLLDAWGQAMDQDGDGTAGEEVDDRYTATFTITGNTAPTAVALSPNTVAENEPAGTTVGTLSTTDAEGGTHTYLLVAGAGDTDNASFSISGDRLLTAASFDYETRPTLSVRVRTTDEGGLSFEQALVVTVTDVVELVPPAAPSGLSAAAVSGSVIDLSWTDNAGNETGFKVQRAAASGGPWTDVTTTAADATTWPDTGLETGTLYFYQVIALNGAGESAPSGEASATTWTPAEAWRDQYFGQIENSGAAADAADTDGDGSINIFERAFATVPTDDTSFYVPVESFVTVGEDDHLAVTYRRLQGVSSGSTEAGYTVQGLTYTVRYAATLESGSWPTGSSVLQEVGVTGNGDGSEDVTVRSTAPAGASSRGFLRLEVEPSP